MGRLLRLLCCLILSSSLAALACAAMVHQEWEISCQFKSTDCVRKLGDDWGHKITYEQTAGLASAPLVSVGELQPLLINGRGMFVNCSTMAVGACNATLPECASPVVEPGADREHDDMLMLLMFSRKLKYGWYDFYEQATVLASVPLQLQLLLIDGRGMAARACNATLPEGASPVMEHDAEPFNHKNMLLMLSRKLRYRYKTINSTGLASVPLQLQPLPIDGRGMAARVCNATLPEGASSVMEHDVELFNHKNMLLMFSRKLTYRYKTINSTGLASVPLQLQPLLIDGRGMAARACNATLPEGASLVMEHDAEPFTYDGDHKNVLLMFSRKLKYYGYKTINYVQATGFASVPLQQQQLLIDGRGMAARECAWLSALSFEIEDGNARLIGYPAAAVPSGSTSSSRPPMGYLQYGAALVVVMLLLGEFFATLYLATGRAVADQNPATTGGTVAMSAPAPSASGSLPVGGSHAPPPSPASASSPSSGDPAGASSNNPSGSGTLSTPPSEGAVGTGEEPGSPPRSPPTPSVGAPDNEGLRSSILLGFLAFGTATVVGIFSIGFDHILGGWSRGTTVVYKVSTGLDTISLGLASAFMVAWYNASSASRNPKLLSISEFCAKLSVILSINLLAVIFPCTLGRGACVAAIPSVAVITFLIATVGIWGRVIVGILAGQRRETQLAGDTMV